MQRREFITLISGATAWPLAVRAQTPAMPVIGFISSRSLDDSTMLVAAFRKGLSEAGFREGQNLAIEYRWADGKWDRLPALAADLVHRAVAVLVTTGGEPSALAAKAATSAIPIVFVIGNDPVKLGLVASLNRPGGNATGFSLLATMEDKRLSLLRELVPHAGVIGVLINPNFVGSEARAMELQDAARVMRQQIFIAYARDEDELELAYTTLVQERSEALLVSVDPFFDTKRDQIVAFAAQHSLPALYPFREYAVGGGLISYGIDLTEGYRQAGLYAGQILKGAKPTDLPVVQSVKFETVINLKTAKMLGIDIPATLLARADEVIE
jgi:putative ABC transport system substrate-binding protein